MAKGGREGGGGGCARTRRVSRSRFDGMIPERRASTSGGSVVLSTRYTASMMAMCDLKLSTPHPATHSVRHVEIQQLITHIAAHAAPLELGKDNADIGDTLHLKQLRAKRGCMQLVRNQEIKQQMPWSILQRTIFDLELLALLGELLVWEGLAANSSCRVAQARQAHIHKLTSCHPTLPAAAPGLHRPAPARELWPTPAPKPKVSP